MNLGLGNRRKGVWTVYRYHTGQPIGGGVISYAADGKQYVAVASGMNSPFGWKRKSSPAKIVIFAVP